jgi:protein quaking
MGSCADIEMMMNSSDYLAQLLKDKRQLSSYPNTFIHLERILDSEINRVRGNVLYLGINTEPVHLPEPLGPIVSLSEKLIVPAKEYPEFNFVGRLLGPRGMTAKQLEMDTGCKILIRGQGSMRDKQKEEQMKGKAKWEHLNEDLHVLVTVEDSKNRAIIKLKRAVEEVKKLLLPLPESEDELKKRQLTELALMNGTYRGFNGIFCQLSQGLQFSPPMPMILRSPDQAAGPPIFVAPGPMPMFTGQMTPLQSPAAALTPLPSPSIVSNAPPPLIYPSVTEVNMIYQFDPCGLPTHSPTYEYPIQSIHHTPVNVSYAH